MSPSEFISLEYAKLSLGCQFGKGKGTGTLYSLFGLEKDYITHRGQQRDRVRARDLLCYWCANELGIPMADLARKLDLTLAAVSYAVKRGEKTAKETGWHLDD